MLWTRMRTELRGGARRTLAGALMLALGGCDSDVAAPLGERRDIPPMRGGTLRTASFTELRGLDPVATFDTTSGVIQHLLYDSLLDYDDQGRVVPQLAEGYDVSPDGRQYTFRLRRGVRFHDGQELVASDVKRSLERALHVNTPCPVPGFYSRIEGYDAYHAGRAPELSGVQVDGDYQVTVRLSEPDATFLYVMALTTVAPVCRSAGRTYDRNFSNRSCGTGPFRLEEYTPGQAVKVVRHDGYWDPGKPYLDRIVWYLAMQPHSQRMKFETGELDYMREFSESDSVLYRSDPAWKGLGEFEPPLLSAGMYLNTAMPPFDNRHLRRAVAFALNFDEIAMLRPGHVRRQQQFVPTAILQLGDHVPRQRFDPARALEEMRLAGYPYDPKTQQGGYPHEIPYLGVIDSMGQTAAEVFQQQLARIGIRIRLQIVGWPTFLAKSSRPNTSPMGYAGWTADYPEPSDFYEPLLSSASIQPEESQNSAFFSHPEFDAVLARARRSVHPEERQRLYERLEAIIAEEAPWALGYTYSYYEQWQPYVHGYRPRPVRQQYVRFAWLDRAEQKRATARNQRWWAPLRDRRSPRSLAALLGARR